ncbi:D-alanyl-D-alanine carboxypeptidase family protein [Paenibacillus montanisoli]|uniref:D-alanyl-D-alanine carboxypeptidase family protein n=1 Tax=Paenibacillus montanisoli TaxID=2081970 RepID=A0A328U1Y6_9BACL|nr:D-alanyl-D-alanine carboxypeptidase family protein [Paenibacillus montanisoli]RAP74905.1 D-alanyl-D-alanine carboxypeptidase family protein [Paenibacillus montanisoli]
MIPITRNSIDSKTITLRSGVPLANAYRTVYLNEEQVGCGNLILVNADHPVRKVEPRLAPVAGKLLMAAGKEEPDVALDTVSLAQLTALLDACGARKKIVVVSGYRSKDVQRMIFMDTLVKRGPAYTESYVALPGASEHQTGLAVDVGLASRRLHYIAPSFGEGSADAGRFKRLAPAYGFIQRYEEEKTPITGIACEPWHYRYVGYPHAAVMTDKNLCLEEYTAFLKKHAFASEHLIVEDGDRRFEIYYVEAAPGLTAVPVPNDKDAEWDVSGNNVDGFVVTASYRKEPRRHGR